MHLSLFFYNNNNIIIIIKILIHLFRLSLSLSLSLYMLIFKLSQITIRDSCILKLWVCNTLSLVEILDLSMIFCPFIPIFSSLLLSFLFLIFTLSYILLEIRKIYDEITNMVVLTHLSLSLYNNNNNNNNNLFQLDSHSFISSLSFSLSIYIY